MIKFTQEEKYMPKKSLNVKELESINLASMAATLLNKYQRVLGDFIDKDMIIENIVEHIVSYYEDIINCMPGNVYWLDKNGCTVGCNKNVLTMFGLESHAEFKGLSFEEMIKIGGWSSEAGESFKQDTLDVIRSGKAKLNVEEPPIPDVNGRIIYFLTSRVPLFDRYQNIIGVVGISIDITALKEAELALVEAKEKAEAASQAKSEFIANMSHDIRTPITGMVGMVQDLLNTARETRDTIKNNKTLSREELSKALDGLTTHVEKDSDILIGSVDQLLQLCNEILEVTGLEGGIADQPAESFDLHHLVQCNIDLQQPVARHKKLALSVEIDKNVPQYVKGLKNYTDRTLLNLLSNALKFTETGAVKVKVSLLENKSLQKNEVTVQFIIEDTGIGIPEDKFDVIFEHFSRLTSSYDGVYKGSGLGLYMVKHYVEAMGGSIGVTSKIGEGTCFIVAVPLLISDTVDRPHQSIRTPAPLLRSVPHPRAAASATQASHPSARVLLVEDNGVVAMGTIIALKPFKCAVDLAENGRQAIEKAQNNIYDFILMDVGLPDISGIEVTRAIRAFSDTEKAQVPIFGLTGHANNPEMRRECLEAGMLEVHNKPAQSLVLDAIFQRVVFSANTTEQKQSEDVFPEGDVLIDWEGCLRKWKGDKRTASTLLAMLAKDLINSENTLKKIYTARDVPALRDELHRVLGGVFFLELPKLRQAFIDFQAAVKTEPSDFAVWEQTYQALKKVIGEFHEVYESEEY
jgi:two-component system aerobic respiration control sensor histidine kinase ArcB